MNNNDNTTKELRCDYDALKISELDTVIASNKTLPIKKIGPQYVVALNNTRFDIHKNKVIPTTITARRKTPGVQKRKKLTNERTSFNKEPRENPITKQITTSSSTASNLVVLVNHQNKFQKSKPVLEPVADSIIHPPLLIEEQPTNSIILPYPHIGGELLPIINHQDANLYPPNHVPYVDVPNFEPTNITQGNFNNYIGPPVQVSVDYHRYNESYIPPSPINTNSPSCPSDKFYPHDVRFNGDTPTTERYLNPDYYRYERDSPIYDTRPNPLSPIRARHFNRDYPTDLYPRDFRSADKLVEIDSLNRDTYRYSRERSRSPFYRYRYDVESGYRRIMLSPDRESFRRRSRAFYDVPSIRRGRSYSRDRLDVDRGYNRNVRRSSPLRRGYYPNRERSRSINRDNRRRRSRTPIYSLRDRSPIGKFDKGATPNNKNVSEDRNSLRRRNRSRDRAGTSRTDKDAQKDEKSVPTSTSQSLKDRSPSLDNCQREVEQSVELNSTSEEIPHIGGKEEESCTKTNLKNIEEVSEHFENTAAPEITGESKNASLEVDLKTEMISDEELEEDNEEPEGQTIDITDMELSISRTSTKNKMTDYPNTIMDLVNPETKELSSKSSDINVIIVPSDFPIAVLTEEQIEYIQVSLVDHIEPGEQGTGPQFEGIHLDEGTMVVACKNLESKIWLENTVPKLHCDGATLRTITPDALVGNKIKFSIRVPSSMSGKSARNILDLVKAQNVGLYTDEWRIVDSTETPQGTNIVVYIDKASIKGLRDCKMKPCLGLHKVICNVIEDGEKR